MGCFFLPHGVPFIRLFRGKKRHPPFFNIAGDSGVKKIFFTPEYVRQPQAASPGSKKTLFHVLDCLATES